LIKKSVKGEWKTNRFPTKGLLTGKRIGGRKKQQIMGVKKGRRPRQRPVFKCEPKK